MFAAVLSVAACVFATFVAVLCLRFGRAPGWEDRRSFAAVAITAAAYSVADIPIELGTTDAVVRFNSLLQLFFGCLQVVAWISYTASSTGRKLGRRGRGLQILLAGLGLSVFIPGAVYPGPVRSHTFAPLSLTYREPLITPYGNLLVAVLLLGFVALTVFYALAWRRQIRDAGAHFVALTLVLAMAVCDALTLSGFISLPYLTDFAFAIPTLAVWNAISRRFVEDARALAGLRCDLERQVEARTSELRQTQAALMRAERLAALGEVAAGVAHEVNNPLAVVVSNVNYLAGALVESEHNEEMLESAREAQQATLRVSQIVRQLLNAGRLATARAEMQKLALGSVVEEAIALARPACPLPLAFQAQLSPGLDVAGQHEPLVQAISNLMVHAARRLPSGSAGPVTVDAEAVGSQSIRLVVSVPGTGPNVAGKTAKADPSDLGLAVARRLIESSHGELQIERGAEPSLRLVVELPAACAS